MSGMNKVSWLLVGIAVLIGSLVVVGTGSFCIGTAAGIFPIAIRLAVALGMDDYEGLK